ncbi:serine hydrolase domain-containing protein [Kineococcus radiotolerans]|uniref:Serine-type D-Ala-D-Ala carboxypeptidase n=1 Tax=Kineococcus radiotolerans (strain ATCC BAA-149 / DSM 14245 / SRS30216) TaxID=266940 RepID=A6WBA8_KINRD|nr:serine hydrolase domain-containing protein [Kineococcus radiotolerans]ABS04097.1 Serine-type D-Ala-D-Ala carboxypeptidase [Kineococcus radiotolerans SRS30216 = ATCC BAA-149]
MADRRVLTLCAAVTFLLTGCTSTSSPAPSDDRAATAGASASGFSSSITVTATPVQPLPPQVRTAVDATVAAGAVGAVLHVRDGDRTWAGSAGTLAPSASTDAGVDAGGGTSAVDAPARVASTTKSMVATVVVQLAEEGEFGLDDPVDSVLPGVLPAERGVTVRQLLNHTSGLPSAPVFDTSSAQRLLDSVRRSWTPQERVAAALALPWTNEAGAAFSYSNENYAVLGMLIEHVTGDDLATVLQQRVFTPAGMQDTSYPSDTSMPTDALRGYQFPDTGPGPGGLDTTEQEPSAWDAGAAVISTAPDLNAFFRALFSGELVSSEGVAQMQQIGVEGYGLGLLAGGDPCGTFPVPAGQTPELVFGQRGNGVGYRALALSSPDGQRQAALVWTGTAADPARDPLTEPTSAAVTAGLAATCG